jgi:gamma-glutamyltranspeptidase/glutathione hydrolase
MRTRSSTVTITLALALALALASGRARAGGKEPVGARHGMVVSTSELASRAGVAVLERGGNAVDAAVAVALALAVTWPSAGNLGGGGFMLIRRADGRAEVIDYRERAPLAASRDMYLDGKGQVIPGASTTGYRAVGVPGTVAGLALARERHGTRPWAELVEPARRLAVEGFPLNHHAVLSLLREAPRLGRFADSRRIFLRDGKPYQEGELLVQPELGATLERLAKEGPREFYRGETARRIVADMKAHGGLVTERDLAEYEPTVRQPLVGSYRGHQILTMPPPSSGGVALLEMLNMLERFPVGTMGPNSADEVHLLVEVMRRAFADRAALLGDTDFVRAPVERLVDKAYAAERARTIDPARATPSAKVQAGVPAPPDERPETTHFVVVDAAGNAVTSTFTLNGSFGSAVTAAGTGFLLNNEMDDFTSKPGVPNAYGLLQSEKNAIAPRKRPLSAMTPTLVLKDGRVELVIGSPGGPMIINTVLQMIVDVLDFGMNIREAIYAARVHHQWMPDDILAEPFGLSADTRVALERRGHRFRDKALYFGDAQGIAIDLESGLRLGACDPRQGGIPAGY